MKTILLKLDEVEKNDNTEGANIHGFHLHAIVKANTLLASITLNLLGKK